MTLPDNQNGSTAATAATAAAAPVDDEIDTPFPPLPLESGNPLVYRIILAVLLAISAFLLIYSWNLGLGSLQRPASGLWVFIVAGAILIALPGAWLVKEKFEVFNRQRVFRSAIMVVGLLLFVLLYPLLGFIGAGIASLFLISRYSAEESVRNSLIIAIATPVVLYLLFGAAFSVSLELLPGWL